MLRHIKLLLFITSFAFSFFTKNLTASENLWHQIIPLVGNTDITKARSKEEALKACTAQALLQDGKFYKKLEPEMFQTLESLHLFSHVLPKINKTNLRLGYFYFAKNISQITDDFIVLKNRSAYITYLQQNEAITTEINNILKNLKEPELDYLIKFYSKPPTKANESSNFIEKGIRSLEKLDKEFNKNRYISEIYKRMGQFASLLALYSSANLLLGWSSDKKTSTEGIFITPNMKPDLQKLGFQSLDNSNGNGVLLLQTEKNGTETSLNITKVYDDSIKKYATFLEPMFNIFCKKESAQNYSNMVASNPINAIPITAISILGTTLIAIRTATALKNEFDSSYDKNKCLLYIKDFIKASKEIVAIVTKNPELEHFISEYHTIKAFANHTKSAGLLSDKMINLIELLDYYPFNSQPSYYISWQGKIAETFLLYEEIHHEFMPLLQAFAELDAQICVQKLLTEDQGFCISNWINQGSPALDIQGYWHPVISKDKAIKNNICLGIKKTAANCIITGANAGGKTTAMTAMMLCVVLGQSIGVAPAEVYSATPFARMHTYLDITTNLTNNESLFMAQANRAKHLFDSIKSCNQNQKTFTILDEIFTGTRADFAEKASCQFAQGLASMKHSMAIIATHFPKLTDLEATKLFINYQAAPATINDDGSLTYPYLIIPGISTQNIADYILKNKGIL